jgi:transposase InsO family protein
MTDDGSCYRSEAFAKTCRRLELEHLRTRPYTPRTNGQAERFMGLCLAPYPTTTSAPQRCRPGSTGTTGIVPHGGIKSHTPISRLGLFEDNLLRLQG